MEDYDRDAASDTLATMRLVVPFPTEWSVENDDGGIRVVVPGSLAEPDLLVYVTDLRGMPPTIDASFLSKQLGVASPAHSQVQVDSTRDDQSTKGWPVTIVRGSVLLNGAIIELRLAAFYRVLDQFGVVVVVGKDPQRWRDLVPGLGEMVLAADVDWSGPPASLAEILGLNADHAIFKR